MSNFIIGLFIGFGLVSAVTLGMILARLEKMHSTLMLILGVLSRGTYR